MKKPDRAAIPPVIPPIKPVNSNIKIHLCKWNNCETRAANIFSFGMLLSTAKVIQTMVKDKNPDTNELNGPIPNSIARKNAVKGPAHQGIK